MAAVGAGGALPANAASKPIQLHVDLELDPAREQEMVSAFHNTFEPVIRTQPGFKYPYRLVISFETEEQRQGWIATADHQRVWPAIKKTLTGSLYSASLYDQA